MKPTQSVFISATSTDLGSYRGVVNHLLLSMGIRPVAPTNFSPDFRSLETELEAEIGDCDAVICLVGFAYGPEPSERSTELPRRSFAQIERDIALRLGKPLLCFLAKEDCAFDSQVDEEQEKHALQLAHRDSLVKGRIVAFFTDHDQLSMQVSQSLHHHFSVRRPVVPATLPCDPSSKKRVFISAKSADFGYAREVFDFLKSHGIVAFLSDESLPELGSSDYRKEIDRALDQADHMVVVTSSREHVESTWVEAEWGFFVNEKRSGRKTGNLVTIVTRDLQPKDLPPSLRYYEVLPFQPKAFEKLLRYVGR